MLTLFKNAHIYSPQYAGKKDVLVGGKSIIAVDDNIGLPSGA
jgi:beta-aspartyl-dipeptidase (metallo-type)